MTSELPLFWRNWYTMLVFTGCWMWNMLTHPVIVQDSFRFPVCCVGIVAFLALLIWLLPDVFKKQRKEMPYD